MKISAAWLCVFLGLAGNIQRTEQAAVMTTVAAITTAATVADKLTDLVIFLDKKLLKPIVDKVNKEIEQIDTDLDGLIAEEKELMVDAKKKLQRGRSDIQRMRTALNLLAGESISRIDMIIRLFSVGLKKGVTASKQKSIVSIAMRKMADLVTRSTSLISEAKGLYRNVATQLTECRQKLEAFSGKVSALADKSSSRFESEAKKLRKKVYSATAGCLLLPPACAIAYPIAAATVESQINKWADRLDNMMKICAQTEKNAQEMANTIAKEVIAFEEEEKLVLTWESKLNKAAADFQAQVVDKAISAQELFAQGIKLDGLKNLAIACQAFQDHIKEQENSF